MSRRVTQKGIQESSAIRESYDFPVQVPHCRQIWSPRPMKIFSLIGFMYALGDYLEMASRQLRAFF